MSELIEICGSACLSNRNKALLYYHVDCLKHTTATNIGKKKWSKSPECAQRISFAYDKLSQYGLLQYCNLCTAFKAANATQLLKCHSQCYIKRILSNDKAQQKQTREESGSIHRNKLHGLLKHHFSHKGGWYSNDTYYNQHTPRACQLACGAAIDLIQNILRTDNDSNTGFCLIRPPGHHCECNPQSQMMGFCLFNNVAVAIENNRHFLPLDKQRIIIIDFDVHHGNGIQNFYYNDPNVIYLSIHKYDNGAFYPQSGHLEKVGGEKAKGTNINIPLNESSIGDSEYIFIFKHIVLPIINECDPYLIVVSAGFDSLLDDVGGYNVTPPCYGLLTRLLLSETKCRKVAMVLEGGYNLKLMPVAISCVVYALLRGSLHQNVENVTSFYREFVRFVGNINNDWCVSDNNDACKVAIHDATKHDIMQFVTVHSRYWKCLRAPLCFV